MFAYLFLRIIFILLEVYRHLKPVSRENFFRENFFKENFFMSQQKAGTYR
jgi:hypothetical protein